VDTKEEILFIFIFIIKGKLEISNCGHKRENPLFIYINIYIYIYIYIYSYRCIHFIIKQFIQLGQKMA